MCRTNGTTVIRQQATSEIGIESQIASVRFSMKCGRIQMTGRMQTPWRSAERTTAVSGFPIAWKYVVATMLSEMHQSMQLQIRKSDAASFKSPGLSDETNILAIHSGNGGTVWIMQATTTIAVVIQSPEITVSRTLR